MSTMNRLLPLANQPLYKSNSTSSIFNQTINLSGSGSGTTFSGPGSIYAGSITDPSIHNLVGSVSTMLHCQMMRDVSANPTMKKMLPFFNEEMYTGKPVLEIPSTKLIVQFLKQVFDIGQFHPECCIISLVYINRLIGVTQCPLTQSNWKPIAISALVLAQKVWDDTPLINADFSILYPALTVKEINQLERKFLDLLEFKLAVSPSLYAQYYFELRSISEENHVINKQQNNQSNNQSNNQLKGISKYVLRRVEQRSHLSEEYQKNKYQFRKQTMTVEDIGYNKNFREIIS